MVNEIYAMNGGSIVSTNTITVGGEEAFGPLGWGLHVSHQTPVAVPPPAPWTGNTVRNQSGNLEILSQLATQGPQSLHEVISDLARRVGMKEALASINDLRALEYVAMGGSTDEPTLAVTPLGARVAGVSL